MGRSDRDWREMNSSELVRLSRHLIPIAPVRHAHVFSSIRSGFGIVHAALRGSSDRARTGYYLQVASAGPSGHLTKSHVMPFGGDASLQNIAAESLFHFPIPLRMPILTRPGWLPINLPP